MVEYRSRRNFLRFATLSGLGIATNPLSAFASHDDQNLPRAKLKKNQQLITLLQTTDVHCQLHAHDELFWENGKAVFRKAGGYAHLATYFEEARQANPNTFIIDTGDMFQGSQLSVETTGQAIQPILNTLGYDLYIPGNWEVVFGKENMIKLMGGLRGPKICTNMFHDNSGQKGEFVFQPYYTWNVSGIKIGFLSYTDPLVPLRQSPDYSKGIIYTHPEENLSHYVKLLKEREQCDYIILLSHLGLSQQIALANNPVCKGVDYIFGGDTHERVRKPIVCKYSKVVEPGAFGSFVGKLDLVVEDGRIVNDYYSLDEVNPVKYRENKFVKSTIEQQEQSLRADINKIVGYSTIPLYRYFVAENTIDTLIIDALKWKIEADIVLSNGFRFCPPNNTPDATGHIPITQGYIYDMLPVDAVVRTGKVSGKQIIDWLEKELNNVFSNDASKRFGGWVVKFKGMKVEFAAFDKTGQRVKKVTVNNRPIELQKMYLVSACEREGDPPNTLCRIRNVQEARNTPFTLHQVLTDYLASNSPVTPKPQGNAIILDAPSTMLTQVQGIDYEFI